MLRLINFAHSEVFMIGTFGSLFTLHALEINGDQTGFTLVGVLLVALLGGHGGLGGDRCRCSSGSPTGPCDDGAPAGWPR